jgi:hypothetical protein
MEINKKCNMYVHGGYGGIVGGECLLFIIVLYNISYISPYCLW